MNNIINHTIKGSKINIMARIAYMIQVAAVIEPLTILIIL